MSAHEFNHAEPGAPPAQLPYTGDDGAMVSVDTAGATTGQVVTYDADARGSGKPGFVLEDPAPSVGALDDLTDVNAPAPSDGDVLTWDGTANEWVPEAPAAPGGGSGGSTFGYTPDLTGPNDLDFATLGGLGGGTVLGSPATTPSIVDGTLRIVSGVLTSADAKGVEWTAPGGAFTVTAKIWRRTNRGVVFGSTFLFLGLGSNRAGAHIYKGPAATYGWVKYSALTNRVVNGGPGGGGDASGEATMDSVFFLRAAYDGTNVTYSVGATGHPSGFHDVLTESAATFLGGAPTAFGILIDNFSGSGANAIYVEWIDVS